MKRQLLALSLIASSGLIAQEGKNQPRNENGYCSTCCCAPCCCKPCCVPKPKPCIDCECYSPSFYDLQCDWGFFFDIAFLYWYAAETDLSYALQVNGVPPITGSTDIYYAPNSYKYIGSEWDPGVRLGLGWNSECDGWDIGLFWTWMKNSSNNSSSNQDDTDCGTTTTGLGLINPWIDQSFHTEDSARLFDKVSAKWRLTFNQVDLEIGRKYWTSRCFAIRPYAALRGAWWKTNFNVNADSSVDVVISPTLTLQDTACFHDKFKNNAWGVGFLGGLQPTWYFCSNFALYSNFDVALIWGGYTAKKSSDYQEIVVINSTLTPTISYDNSSKGEFSQMTPMLDTAIGLRWEETWCCDRYRTALDFGWEHHVLFDANHRQKTYDYFLLEGATISDPSTSGFRTYEEATGNIGLGGFVLRARFDF